MIAQKRFYTRGTIRDLKISQLAKIIELTKGELLELHRREGGLERYSM